MGLSVKNYTKKVIHFELLHLSHFIEYLNMVDSVEATTPIVEVAANGASENAAEVSETTAAEKTVETENGDSTKEAANGKETETEKETEAEAPKEEKEVTNASEEASTEEVTVEGGEAEEATKRKAETPSEDETVEKIAKLKETAAEVVSEAEKKLPEEPLTEEEATAEATA